MESICVLWLGIMIFMIFLVVCFFNGFLKCFSVDMSKKNVMLFLLCFLFMLFVNASLQCLLYVFFVVMFR